MDGEVRVVARENGSLLRLVCEEVLVQGRNVHSLQHGQGSEESGGFGWRIWNGGLLDHIPEDRHGLGNTRA